MKYLEKTMPVLIIAALSLTLVNCTTPTENEILSPESLAKYGTGSVIDLPLEELSSEEAEGLVFMREEEKVARDVYNYFYAKYNQVVFSNIAASEQKHMNAVKLLLDKYELADPAENDIPGQYTNSSLQELYNNLIAAGDVSLIEALKVGGLIEEVDILDLKNQIENVIDNEDISVVYNNLMTGSYNHLKGFVRTLAANGVTYEPQQISEDLYNEILDSATGNGQKGYRGGR